jgi:hypothetical protein
MTELPSSSSFWTSNQRQLILVFVVALILRFWFVFHYGAIQTNDSAYYLTLAHDVLNGKGLGIPHRAPPVYPLFLASVLAVWDNVWAILWAQVLLGAVTCVVLAATCQRLFQPRLAFILSLAVALYVPMAAFCAVVMRETLITFGISVTTYFLVRVLHQPAPRWVWATALGCVFTFFTQFTFLFFPLWAGLAYWIHTRSFKRAFQWAWPIAACLAASLGFWAGRNYLVTQRFIPLSTDHIGYFLLEGILDANENDKSLTPDQKAHLGLAPDDPYTSYKGMRDHYWEGGLAGGVDRKLQDGPLLLSRAVKLIQYQPGKYLRFCVKRLHRLWFKDLWVERTEESYLNLRPLDRFRRQGMAALAVTALIYAFGYGGVVAMALFGRQTLALLVPVVTMLSFHVWIHAETRYALPIHPHLLIFSLLTLVGLFRLLLQRRSLHEIRADLMANSKPSPPVAQPGS